mmetsp:Transcript_41957/g.76239  ORF Transcript_41957/g.76239 Transcript_41957/m.76239 type:complete len:498 (-) Transcript_41957:16-1509(-)
MPPQLHFMASASTLTSSGGASGSRPQSKSYAYRASTSNFTEEIIEEASNYDDEDDVAFKMEERLHEMQMQKMMATKTPQVPPWPAPPVGASREAYRGPLPAYLILEDLNADGHLREKTALDRMLNSSVGRFLVFLATLLLFGVAAVGVVIWNTPVLRLGGQADFVLAGTIGTVAILYTLVPKLAERTGMTPRESGWKPYLVIYRFAFVTALPALVLLGVGYGHRIAFGEETVGSGEDLIITKLSPESLKYFEALDGFVALNLTKAIAETLMDTLHGDDAYRRSSRFRDAEMPSEYEFSSENTPEPTMPPGMLRMYRIAPIFTEKVPCVSGNQTDVDCLSVHPVRAWAVSSTISLCSSLRVVACKAPFPELKPVYKCTSESPIQGSGYTGDVQGLCGRVVQAPRQGVIDELNFLLSEDSWPLDGRPNSTSIWIDITPDECIGDFESCDFRWSTAGLSGVVFGVLTFCFVAIPAVVDCVVDRWIRTARYMIERSERMEL